MNLRNRRQIRDKYVEQNAQEFTKHFKGASLSAYITSNGYFDTIKFGEEFIDQYRYMQVSRLCHKPLAEVKKDALYLIGYPFPGDNRPEWRVISEFENKYGSEATRIMMEVKDNPRNMQSELIRQYGQAAWDFYNELADHLI